MFAKKIGSFAMVFLLVIGGFTFFIINETEITRATTLYVGGSGSGNYTSIQDAIDDSYSGDTVYVYSGIYSGGIMVDKSINLTGESKEGVVIDGSSNYCLNITANWVNISGFTITDGGGNDSQGNYWGGGVLLSHISKCKIYENNISDNIHSGIYLNYSSNISIENNEICSNFGVGVYLSHSFRNSISENLIKRNYCPIWPGPFSGGVYLVSSDNNDILRNNESNNNFGIKLIDSSENNTISDNEIIGTYTGSGPDGIWFDNSNNNKISNNIISHTDKGIQLSSSSSNRLYNNTISNSTRGIYISDCSKIRLSNNTVSSSWETAISLYSSIKTTFKNNNMLSDGIFITGGKLRYWNTHEIDTSNTVNGKAVQYWKNRTSGTISSIAGEVILANCTEVTVENNNLTGDFTGIQLGFSDSNTVTNNSASSKNNYGIYLQKSNNNTLTNNTAYSEEWYGIYLISSSNNTIYHNNFLHAHDNGDNLWNTSYPSGGNYWGDYYGSDNYSGPEQDQPGSDGIGDTNYSIPGGINVDNYPLMFPTYMDTCTIELSSQPESDGWQFISIPIQPSDDNLENVLSYIDGNYDKVMYYNSANNEWNSYKVGRAEHYNDIKTINHTMGFWVHMTGDDTLMVGGYEPVSTNITLQPGWNMVGYPSETNRLASDVLPPEVSKIGVFNKWAPYNIEYIYDLSTEAMVAGRGYWVYNNANYSVISTVNY